MGDFGSQTSFYSRLVIIFVAIGSMVSELSIFDITTKTQLALSPFTMLTFSRPMVIVLRSSVVQLANQAGISTSTFPPTASPDMLPSQRRSSRLPMESSAPEEPSARCSLCGHVIILDARSTSSWALSSVS